jgi:hypothetical protein
LSKLTDSITHDGKSCNLRAQDKVCSEHPDGQFSLGQAQIQPMMAQYPLGFERWLQALAYALSKPRKKAIVGDADSADAQAWLRVIRDSYRLFQIVARGSPDTQASMVPLLQDRGLVDE